MAGIYIHIPFCKKKCTYCDFHFSTTFEKYRERMILALQKELILRSKEINEKIETIYFGGGTPSLLTERELSQFFTLIQENYHLSENLEITLEANPDDISEMSVKAWKNLGINRLSIGLQSFDEEDLVWMNRAHTSKESIEAVKIAQKNGIDNLSIDLIYGLPNMDLKRWEKQVNQAIALGVPHISAYCLTVEEKTALHQLVQQKKLFPAENELQSAHFSLLQDKLKEANYIQYEVSNFGKENFFSQHNSSYWKGKSYLGIGPSAHSFHGDQRSWNISNNSKYMDSLDSAILPSENEILSKKDQFNETLLIGLRSIWGVSLEKLNSFIPLTNKFHQKLELLINDEKAELIDNVLFLKEKGLHFADAIAMDLFE
jgi:oxygen-independent coproporphyrinogen-3 oxidase